MPTANAHRIDTLRIAAAPAAGARFAGVSDSAFTAGVGLVDRILAADVVSLAVILLLISLVIVG